MTYTDTTRKKMEDNIHLPGTIDEFIENNLGLVYDVCNRYSRSQALYKTSMDPEDLFQVGCMGLLHAYSRYDGQGKFSTYAVHCIRGYILSLFLKTNHGVHYSVNIRRNVNRIRKLKLSEEPIHIISEETGIPGYQVEAALHYISHGKPSSIHAVVKTGIAHDTDYLLQDIIPDITVSTSNWERDLEVKVFADTLSETHRKVMVCTMQGYTTRQIGSLIGISQTRVSQIWNSILEKAHVYGGCTSIVPRKVGRPRKAVNA